MRKEFSAAIEKLAREDERIVFITGDLGFNALENVQQALGPRFINAGVAEQSMVSMAAGMSYKGYTVICYSIAPFTVFRPLEQIRNDICFHKKPVILVGNGGGFGYGIMGSTHHSISDIAALSSLPNMTCAVPAFTNDVEPMLTEWVMNPAPAYFRLGNSKQSPHQQERYGNFHKVFTSAHSRVTIIALGPIVTNVLDALATHNFTSKADLFTAIHMPITELHPSVIESIQRTKKVLVVEEHVEVGGLGQAMAIKITSLGLPLDKFISLNAKNYPSGLYGDQQFHQRESGLDPENIGKELLHLLS